MCVWGGELLHEACCLQVYPYVDCSSRPNTSWLCPPSLLLLPSATRSNPASYTPQHTACSSLQAIAAWRDSTGYGRCQLVKQYFSAVEGFTQPEVVLQVPLPQQATPWW
jgi:hypothetical protein